MTRNRQPQTSAISVVGNAHSAYSQFGTLTSMTAQTDRAIIVTFCLEEPSLLSESEVLELMLQHHPD